MSDIIGRLASLGTMGPELTLQILGMVMDGLGTGTEWSGEELDRLGEMVQEMADRVRGIQEAKGT